MTLVFQVLLTVMLTLTGFLFETNSAKAQNPNITQAEITVLGNCGMCKERIERAAYGIRGVRRANWTQQDQVLSLEYRNDRTDQETIERAIAKAGHDTENFITDEETHANLHHCCIYERNEAFLENNRKYDDD